MQSDESATSWSDELPGQKSSKTDSGYASSSRSLSLPRQHQQQQQSNKKNLNEKFDELTATLSQAGSKDGAQQVKLLKRSRVKSSGSASQAGREEEVKKQRRSRSLGRIGEGFSLVRGRGSSRAMGSGIDDEDPFEKKKIVEDEGDVSHLVLVKEKTKLGNRRTVVKDKRLLERVAKERQENGLGMGMPSWMQETLSQRPSPKTKANSATLPPKSPPRSPPDWLANLLRPSKSSPEPLRSRKLPSLGSSGSKSSAPVQTFSSPRTPPPQNFDMFRSPGPGVIRPPYRPPPTMDELYQPAPPRRFISESPAPFSTSGRPFHQQHTQQKEPPKAFYEEQLRPHWPSHHSSSPLPFQFEDTQEYRWPLPFPHPQPSLPQTKMEMDIDDEYFEPTLPSGKSLQSFPIGIPTPTPIEIASPSLSYFQQQHQPPPPPPPITGTTFLDFHQQDPDYSEFWKTRAATIELSNSTRMRQPKDLYSTATLEGMGQGIELPEIPHPSINLQESRKDAEENQELLVERAEEIEPPDGEQETTPPNPSLVNFDLRRAQSAPPLLMQSQARLQVTSIPHHQDPIPPTLTPVQEEDWDEVAKQWDSSQHEQEEEEGRPRFEIWTDPIEDP